MDTVQGQRGALLQQIREGLKIGRLRRQTRDAATRIQTFYRRRLYLKYSRAAKTVQYYYHKYRENIWNAMSETCSVCLERQHKTTKLCKTRACDGGKACKRCAKEYFHHSLKANRYVQDQACPGGCSHKIPFRVWRNYADSKTVQSYQNLMKNLLSIRCNSCHTEHTLFAKSTTKPAFNLVLHQLKTGESNQKMPLKKSLPQSCDEELFQRYQQGALSANELIISTFGLPPAEEDPMWMVSETKAKVKSKCDDAQLIAEHIADEEMRFKFQIAFFNMHRSCITPCTCSRRMCFYCKSPSHVHMNCEQHMNRTYGNLNFCPRCKVPCMKNDGCNSVRCVCGLHFTWRERDELGSGPPPRSIPPPVGTIRGGYVRTAGGWEAYHPQPPVGNPPPVLPTGAIPPPPQLPAPPLIAHASANVPLPDLFMSAEQYGQVRQTLAARISQRRLPHDGVLRPTTPRPLHLWSL